MISWRCETDPAMRVNRLIKGAYFKKNDDGKWRILCKKQ